MSNKLTVVADENIPGLDELLEGVADIHYLPGRHISAVDLVHADALLIRSVTRVNDALLSGSNLSFIGSCTIGTDHVDLDCLKKRNVTFANAPGCNAAAVVDYVITALFSLNPDISFWQDKCVGIVGLGEVGGRLKQRLNALGIKTRCNDPFKSDAKESFQDVLSCDVVSLHVPLAIDGRHKTHHLLSSQELQLLKPGAVLINTSRGAVVDNRLLSDYVSNRQLHVVLDVYEDEPVPTVSLLKSIDIATSHIAGYSLQGKIRGSVQVVEALYRHFSIARDLPDLLAPLRKEIKYQGLCLQEVLSACYDIKADSENFIFQYSQAGVSESDKQQTFDNYRKNFPARYEFSYIDIESQNLPKDILIALGFQAK